MKKVTISTELSRDALGMVAQMAGEEITDEMWDKLTEKPISVNLKDLDDRTSEVSMIVVLAGLAFKEVDA
ncbi:MAG: hypothetical protein IJT48_01570 [Bacteroidaceae bacterium]|nr:hypothetical protein [Bacteroidaceae bacterium]